VRAEPGAARGSHEAGQARRVERVRHAGVAEHLRGERRVLRTLSEA
jgi:hypothetical protein